MGIVKRCEQITLDFERGNFQELSVKDRLEMKMHMAICTKCRRYAKDSKKMDLWLKRRYELANFSFSDGEKEVIKEKCKQSGY
jgi:hypothetical protein